MVRPLAERLRADGVKVWPDEWEIPVASVYDRRGEGRRSQSAATAAKIEEGLEHSRLLARPAIAAKRRRKAHTYDAPINGSLARSHSPSLNPLT